MRTTIDAAGRIVVPKALRDTMGLRPGQALELEVRDGRLEIEAASTSVRLERRGGTPFAVPEADLPALSAEQVRATLEQTRR